MLSVEELGQFKDEGFLVVRQLAAAKQLADLSELTRQGLASQLAPFELEADVQYPGAPMSRNASGGQTVRRLLQAYQRHPVFREWASNAGLTSILRQLLGCDTLLLSQAHHNCVMTKQPKYSSKTLWHQDVRYWQFSQPYLVNVWLALGQETTQNGGMWLIPGSHLWQLMADRLDGDKFLIPDHPLNRPEIEQAVQIELQPGDALLFDARSFHAAGQNLTSEPKFALVYSYHGPDTQPLPDTRSSSLAEIQMP